MELKKLSDFNIMDFGNKFQIAGMILANGEESYAILFSDTSIIQPTLVRVTHEEWGKLLFQLDTLEVQMFSDNPEGKIVMRKSQRNIEQNISWNVFRRDAYRCLYCAAYDKPLTVDHIVRWENYGQSIETNLISSCSKCNKTRGNIEFEDWLTHPYLMKVISVWPFPDKQLEHLHQRWLVAKQLPLRSSKRNR